MFIKEKEDFFVSSHCIVKLLNQLLSKTLDVQNNALPSFVVFQKMSLITQEYNGNECKKSFITVV